jgi:hypothetical protein
MQGIRPLVLPIALALVFSVWRTEEILKISIAIQSGISLLLTFIAPLAVPTLINLFNLHYSEDIFKKGLIFIDTNSL